MDVRINAEILRVRITASALITTCWPAISILVCPKISVRPIMVDAPIFAM